MRMRTVAVSAALVLCATAGTAACSSSPDTADTADATRPAAPATPVPVDGMAGYVETGERQAGPPETDGRVGAGPAECETSAAAIPAECALDIPFHDIAEAEPAGGPPVR
ncbi:hypothetical protein [Streptomyces sp. rh34]|uniref:hypothetical protein n=1 Tax=Streptomyces sp. rh34 TaxID=2034272 RepID=UPI000BF15F45|nr:hypothetical protein [Streptomyces sp. rh34]